METELQVARENRIATKLEYGSDVVLVIVVSYMEKQRSLYDAKTEVREQVGGVGSRKGKSRMTPIRESSKERDSSPAKSSWGMFSSSSPRASNRV